MSDKPSRLSRLSRLGGLTSRVAGRYMGNRIRRAFQDGDLRKRARDKLHIDNAREIVDTVGKMKGAAMKLGQQMAQAASALDLPEEVASTLSQLNKDADPVPFDIIREDIETELECSIDEAFKFFDETPLGTASLGQAHLATLHDGSEVVVKILHRGVEQSVETDLMAVKALLVSGRILNRPKKEVDATFDEVKARLTEELDYLQEAANIATFYRQWKHIDWLTIPTVHPSHCTERILTMDRIQGVHIDEFVATASPEARQLAAERLSEMYYTQVFTHRTLHADPHPGNYLFQSDGTIGLIDFGCVKRFDEFWIGSYARAACAIMDDDRDTCLDAAVDIGAWTGERTSDGDQLWAFCQALGEGLNAGIVTMGAPDEHLLDSVRRTTKPLVTNGRVTLPKDLIFLHRSLGGLYALQRTLQAPVNYGDIVRPLAEQAVRRSRGEATD